MKKVLLALLILMALPAAGQEKLELLILRKAHKQALQLADSLLNVAPSAEIYYRKGLILREQLNHPGCLAAFRAAVEMEPDNVRYFSELGEVFLTLGDLPEAEEVLRTASGLEPENLPLKAQYGRALIGQSQNREAYQLFHEIVQADSLNVHYNKQLAMLAGRMGKFREACARYERVLELYPRDLGVYSRLAEMYLLSEQLPKADLTLKRGLAFFPDNTTLLLKRATSLFTGGKYREALPSYEKWLSITRDSVLTVLKQTGICLYFDGQEERALDMLQKIFFSTPNDPYICFYIGMCYKKLGDFKKSKDFLEMAIESAMPSYLGEMYHNLAQVHGLLREFEESVAMLQKAYERNPSNHEILFEIATTYEEYNSNKTLALNYYRVYLLEAKEDARNAPYALKRITRLKEELFFESE